MTGPLVDRPGGGRALRALDAGARSPGRSGRRRYTAGVSMSLIFAALLVAGIVGIGVALVVALVRLLARSYTVRG